MYETKRQIYLYFDKTQKSMICTFLRSYVKKNIELSSNEILNKFIDEQDYYLKINNSRFEFLKDYLTLDTFLEESKKYISACLKYYLNKKEMAPYIEKQKQFEKEKRNFLQELKMSKEKPTKKQISYYTKLCKRHNIEIQDVTNFSKLDIKKEIERILNEFTRNSTNTN